MDENGAESTEELHFFYDAQSRPAFVEYEGSMYRYIHNLQGDIVAIVDAAGNPVIEYKYDAWGKPISITGTLKTTLGELNPFRYRGYMYDAEMEFYYLRNRYYYIDYVRFLNSDIEIGVTVFLFAHNLWAFCRNDPIAYVDPDGDDPWRMIIPNWGMIHNEVQRYLAEQYGFEKEVQVINLSNGKTGRVDLMSHSGEIYEIKPNNARALSRGEIQLMNYLSGTVKMPPANFEGFRMSAGSIVFQISFISEDKRFRIDVESFGNGMIGYRFDIAQETKTSPKEVTDSNPLNRIVDFLALISRLIVDKTQGFGGATGGGGGGFCGGAGSGRH